MTTENIIYTDGASKGNPGPGGWGAIVFSGRKVLELGGFEKNTTNNRMELTAAIEALRKIKGSAILYTDSSYLINGITKWIYSWERRNWVTKNKETVLNKDLWESLLEVVRGRKIDWVFVKGHTGNAGNERVDQIATIFADGDIPKLFSGYTSRYSLKEEILQKPVENRKSNKSKAPRKKGKPYSYLSMVKGVVKKHKSWEECKKRVLGVSGAKFKKTTSLEDEKKTEKEWRNI